MKLLIREGLEFHLKNIEIQAKRTVQFDSDSELAEVSQKSIERSKEAILRFYDKMISERIVDENKEETK